MSGTTGAISTGHGGAHPTGSGLGRGAVNEASSGTGTTSTNWPLISQLELGPLPTAVGCGRDHAELVLAERGVDHLADDDAVLLVSELLTNTLKASRTLPTPTTIVLRLLANYRQLIIEARDQRTDGLELTRAAPDADHGRGMQVVAALSRRSGVGRVSEQHKTALCGLRVRAARNSPVRNQDQLSPHRCNHRGTKHRPDTDHLPGDLA